MSKKKKSEKAQAEPQGRKETTVAEAEAVADKTSSVEGLENLMLDECYKMATGEQHSAQQMLAYARRSLGIQERKK